MLETRILEPQLDIMEEFMLEIPEESTTELYMLLLISQELSREHLSRDRDLCTWRIITISYDVA